MYGQQQQPMYVQPQKSQSSNGCLKAFLIFIGICFFFAIISNIFGDDKNSSEAKDSESKSSVQKETANVSSEPEPVKWEYRETTDEMTDTKNRWASITSDNYITQEFPYSGETYADITVRYMKKYGTDVLISISMGQIIGNDFTRDNYINVRFDDSEPRKYYFNHPEDLSTETIFLSKSSDFIQRCKTAKDIKVEIPIFQSGRAVFKFHVDECLDW